MSVNAISSRSHPNPLLKNRQLIGIDLGATNVRVARIGEDGIEQIKTEAVTSSLTRIIHPDASGL